MVNNNKPSLTEIVSKLSLTENTCEASINEITSEITITKPKRTSNKLSSNVQFFPKIKRIKLIE